MFRGACLDNHNIPQISTRKYEVAGAFSAHNHEDAAEHNKLNTYHPIVYIRDIWERATIRLVMESSARLPVCRWIIQK